ncbi:MAG: hypothetical protein HRU03_04775, partial [Nanoarchaeales archaeon]|nr:hypothetical protein [Nanoarchaeales archaeon]
MKLQLFNFLRRETIFSNEKFKITKNKNIKEINDLDKYENFISKKIS